MTREMPTRARRYADAPANIPRRNPRFAIPAQLEFFGDVQAERAWLSALEQLTASGATLEPLDFAPFRTLAEQLYYGPWVAERTVAIEQVLDASPQAIDPVVRGIVGNGLSYSACDAYKAEYLRAELARQIPAAGAVRRAGGADRAHYPHPGGDGAGAGAVQLAVRHLHQFHQPGRSERAGAAGAAARRRAAGGHHADRAGLA